MISKLGSTSLGVIVITAISLIGTAVVAATGHVVDSQWWTLNYVLVGAVGGVTVPALTTTTAAPKVD